MRRRHRPRAATMRQLSRLEPEPASAPFPDEIVAAIREDRAASLTPRLRRVEESAFPHVPEIAPGTEAAVEAWRPSWTDLVYVPRVSAHRPPLDAPIGWDQILLLPPAMTVYDAQLVPGCLFPW